MDDMDMFDGLTEREIYAFERWQEKYRALSPPPPRPSIRGMGWQFWLTVFTTLSAILLAALRTADQFYRAAFLEGNAFLAWVQAAVAILAIEGGLVVYAMRLAIRRRTGFGWLSYVSMAFMVLISMIAGLGQSANLVPQIDPLWLDAISYGLMVILGIGATVVAAIGGHVLGQVIVEMENWRERAQQRYQEDLQDWREEMLSKWTYAPERRLARAELTALTASTKRELAPETTEGVQARRQIVEYLEDNGLDPHEVQPKDVAEILGLKGNTTRVALKRLRDEANGR